MRTSLLMLTTAISLGTAASAKPFTGPFALNDGLTFYLVNHSGVDFDLKVKWYDPLRDRYPRPTMIRVFDPEENLLFREEFAGEVIKPVPWEEKSLRVESAGPGVYQVIVHGWGGAQVEISTTPELDFGVFGHLQWLAGQKEQFADTYVYLPPGLRKLPIIASDKLESLVLTDESGTEKSRLNKDTMQAEVALPSGDEHVWKLSARGAGYRLNFKGYPIILCPTADAAKFIRASVDVMPDGSICFHKHQAAAWRLLQQWKKRPASDYQVEVKPLKDYEAALLKEPARSQLLFGHYGVLSALPAILSEQCLDPHSAWFGSIRCWKDEKRNAREDNPLADYTRDGREEYAGLTKDIAALYWLKSDCNPYYHDRNLLHRVIIGVLLDQMVMKEGEFCNPDNTYYYGIHAFTLCHSQSGAFSLVYKDVPPEVQKVWHAGQQRLTDRMLYGPVGGCVNQWTVLLAGLWRYYEGTGEAPYREAILRNLHWLTSCALWNHGQRAAGYMTEASGPDATYNGITGHYLAYLYHQTKDSDVLESLRRCYRLFNHTITPEPDGTWLGSSGYCHRTPGDWTSPQYGAGLGPMARHLPEAGVRFPDHLAWAYARPAFDAESRKAAESRLREVMAYFPANYFDLEKSNVGRASGAFDILFANYRNFSNEFLPGKLPCEEMESFTRNFDNEFFCVKRKDYYAFLYGGVAYGLWQAGTRPEECNHQFPHNDGLCLFWSPEFGVSLLSKNWSAGQANTLLATLDSGKVEWPWYWDTKSKFDTDNATVEMTGKIHDTPLTYARKYRFLDDRIVCELTVTATAPISLKGLSEGIPYPLPEVKPGGLQVKLLNQQGEAIEDGAPTKGVFLTNASGKGHLLVLSEPLPVLLTRDHSTDHYGGEHDWDRVVIQLPKEWQTNQTLTLKYSLLSCNADGAVQYCREE
ncbi:MAG: hypothetical protein COS85_22430 [Armatimonadetes bacterium CG07_land_8_20_14_0_80_59_28]|nr:MAG: hypothetical protein COS85_22430 [Armatimonadetes bacterium CG07_land_8_20_14_0_80_59_28]